MHAAHFVLVSVAVLLCCVSCRRQRIKIRLRNGKHRYEGRIQLFRDGKWADVCDDKWDLKAARVACRMLGFPDAERFTFGDWWGRGTGTFWLEGVVCHGDEDTLESCAHRDWGVSECSSDNVAGVICRDYEENRIIHPKPHNASKKIIDLPVRLLGRPKNFQISHGVLQVKVNGKWGFVCNDKWTYKDSKVACGMLGYPNAIRDKMLRSKTARNRMFLMGSVSCHGLESSLVECEHQGWGPLKCEGFAVNLECELPKSKYKHSRIRLRGSHQLHEGRIEVKSKDPRESLHWGTVCDDGFDLKDANVACRTLGLGTASRVFTNAKFGQGIRSIYMDNVRCRGWEPSFELCPHKTNSDCTHYEDVSVRCNAPELQTRKIRLFGGNNKLEGYVEIRTANGWGGVCAKDWGLEEAIVTCRELNLGFAHQATKGNYFRSSNSPITFSGIKCKIDDQSLSYCPREKKVPCDNNDRAGVICVTAVPDLVVNVEELEKNVRVDAAWLQHLRCAYEEKCLAESAQAQWESRSNGHMRRLLRFTTRVENRGLAPFKPNVPQTSWQWHVCHNHYHSMETFSNYELFTMDSKEVAAGHKASFCLEDTVCDKGVHKVYNCTNRAPQGVSPNCYDVYKWNIDCQWIDVTDFPHGNFFLRVTVNPERKVPESDYSNNIARCWIYDYGNVAYGSNCHLENCESGYNTHGGNAKGACCVFPFKYKKKWHYKCLHTYWKTLWCGTTSNYDRDRQWGNCY